MIDPAATRFPVRYGSVVKWMTVLAGGLLLVIMAKGVLDPALDPIKRVAMIALPFVVLSAGWLHTVLGYEIDAAGIHVLRPIGRMRIATRLSSIKADPEALRWALRTFGNGGLFSFNGWFRLRDYGKARVWVTDVDSAVVATSERGVIVVSPRDPVAFIARAQTLLDTDTRA